MRIMIVEPSEAGKSTFALQLADRLGLPLYHVDQLFYRANWVERSAEDFLEKHVEVLRIEGWVLDRNVTRSFDPDCYPMLST